MKELIAAIAMLTGTATCAAPVMDALDELMPVPANVERRDGMVDASKLGCAKVVRADVPGAPSSTADESYILEIGAEGVTITASSPRGERWARVTLEQLAKLSDGKVPCCRTNLE